MQLVCPMFCVGRSRSSGQNRLHTLAFFFLFVVVAALFVALVVAVAVVDAVTIDYCYFYKHCPCIRPLRPSARSVVDANHCEGQLDRRGTAKVAVRLLEPWLFLLVSWCN